MSAYHSLEKSAQAAQGGIRACAASVLGPQDESPHAPTAGWGFRMFKYHHTPPGDFCISFVPTRFSFAAHKP